MDIGDHLIAACTKCRPHGKVYWILTQKISENTVRMKCTKCGREVDMTFKEVSKGDN